MLMLAFTAKRSFFKNRLLSYCIVLQITQWTGGPEKVLMYCLLGFKQSGLAFHVCWLLANVLDLNTRQGFNVTSKLDFYWDVILREAMIAKFYKKHVSGIVFLNSSRWRWHWFAVTEPNECFCMFLYVFVCGIGMLAARRNLSFFLKEVQIEFVTCLNVCVGRNRLVVKFY